MPEIKIPVPRGAEEEGEEAEEGSEGGSQTEVVAHPRVAHPSGVHLREVLSVVLRAGQLKPFTDNVFLLLVASKYEVIYNGNRTE